MNPLRRRQDAARRLPPLSCGHADPLVCGPARSAASDYGLTPAAVWRHAADLRVAGWLGWEICHALARPTEVVLHRDQHDGLDRDQHDGLDRDDLLVPL